MIGNTGLSDVNNSTNNRMKKIFEYMHLKYGYSFEYYKLTNAALEVDYINYINNIANRNPIKAFQVISKQNKKYDIVLAETFNASIVAYVLYITKKTPFIWRQFGTTFNDELGFKNCFNPKMLLKFFLHKLITNSSGCKAVVCTEDGCANKALYIDKLGLKLNDKLHMVKNQRTAQTIKYNKVSNNAKNDKLKIVQIGRINKWKKIHLTIQALANIKNNYSEIIEKIELTIIGIPDDSTYEEKLKKIIDDNNLENQVLFKKKLEYNQIEEILQNTNLSISLTAYNPIIESLQNEIPVVTYEYGEIGEVFDKCHAVFVLSRNIKKSSFLSTNQEDSILKELENKLVSLVGQKEKLNSIGKEGKKFVENTFPTLDEHVKEITDIYIKTINAI